MTFRLTRAALACAALCAAPWSLAHDAAATDGALGVVHFEVGCKQEAQREFNLAMAYYHSFAWEQIKAPLDRTLQADPTCGMVHWARALASLDNPFVWPGNVSAKTLADGAALMEAARKTGLSTERERDYVDALAVFFQDADKLNHRTRSVATERAFAKLAAKYAQDSEATILHALLLSATFDPADKQYGNQLRATTLLEPVFAKQPQHPGGFRRLVFQSHAPSIFPAPLTRAAGAPNMAEKFRAQSCQSPADSMALSCLPFHCLRGRRRLECRHAFPGRRRLQCRRSRRSAGHRPGSLAQQRDRAE